MNRSTAFLLSGLSGFVTLSHELLWYRVVAFSSGNAAPSFALLLGLYLTGLAIGSEYVGRATSRKTKKFVPLAVLILLGNVLAFLTVPFISVLVSVGAPLLLALGVVVLTAAVLGTQFPLICHLSIPPDERVGENLSFLYVAHIIGAGLGSLLTGLVLMNV